MYRKYPDEMLHKLQATEKEILHDFDNVCQKYDIGYFVTFGTLLGAVRHQDMIPWDDDVDTGMLREDYNRFLEVFDKEMGEKYELLTPEKENRYYSFIPKIALKGTKFLKEEALRSELDDIGIYIEIFVFENISPVKKDLKKQIAKVRMTKHLYSIHQTPNQQSVGSAPVKVLKNIVKKGLYEYEKIAGLDQKKLNQRFLDQTVNPNETGWVSHFGDGTTEKNILKKEDLVPYSRMPFANFEVNVPANYEQLLTQLYGDYMRLPDEEERWNQAPEIIQFENEEEIDFENETESSSSEV